MKKILTPGLEPTRSINRQGDMDSVLTGRKLIVLIKTIYYTAQCEGNAVSVINKFWEISQHLRKNVGIDLCV